jgi:hypothetical protein
MHSLLGFLSFPPQVCCSHWRTAEAATRRYSGENWNAKAGVEAFARILYEILVCDSADSGGADREMP